MFHVRKFYIEQMSVSVRMQFHNHVDQGLKHEARMWPPRAFCAARDQWRSQPKNFGGAKIWGAKLFDFRRITLFCLE